MVKSYCVKAKKQTECVPGSEIYVEIDGRYMMKCTCATPPPDCGITKAKFITEDEFNKKVGSSIQRKGRGKKQGKKKGN